MTEFGDKIFEKCFRMLVTDLAVLTRQIGFSFSDIISQFGDNVEHQIGVTVMLVTSLCS